MPQQCDRRICAGVRSCQRRTTILVWQTTTSNCSPSWTGRAAALPSLQSIPELVRVRRQASGLMSMPDDTSGAAKLSRLERILNVTDVRIAVRGPCRPRRFHPPSACEFSRDFISLPVLKKGTALLPTETKAPVRGFRPVRPARTLTKNTPNPRSSTRSPRDIAAVICKKMVLTIFSASCR